MQTCFSPDLNLISENLASSSSSAAASVSWPISPDDFNAGTHDDTNCIGAVFDVGAQGDEGAWVIGDAFLVSFFLYELHLCSD